MSTCVCCSDVKKICIDIEQKGNDFLHSVIVCHFLFLLSHHTSYSIVTSIQLYITQDTTMLHPTQCDVWPWWKKNEVSIDEYKGARWPKYGISNNERYQMAISGPRELITYIWLLTKMAYTLSNALIMLSGYTDTTMRANIFGLRTNTCCGPEKKGKHKPSWICLSWVIFGDVQQHCCTVRWSRGHTEPRPSQSAHSIFPAKNAVVIPAHVAPWIMINVQPCTVFCSLFFVLISIDGVCIGCIE